MAFSFVASSVDIFLFFASLAPEPASFPTVKRRQGGEVGGRTGFFCLFVFKNRGFEG